MAVALRNRYRRSRAGTGNSRGCYPQEHPDGRPHGRGQDRDRPPAGQARGRAAWSRWRQPSLPRSAMWAETWNPSSVIWWRPRIRLVKERTAQGRGDRCGAERARRRVLDALVDQGKGRKEGRRQPHRGAARPRCASPTSRPRGAGEARKKQRGRAAHGTDVRFELGAREMRRNRGGGHRAPRDDAARHGRDTSAMCSASIMPKHKKIRKVAVRRGAQASSWPEESSKLIDMDKRLLARPSTRAEQDGIVFIDEIDKVAGPFAVNGGPDVSREGVQRRHPAHRGGLAPSTPNTARSRPTTCSSSPQARSTWPRSRT